MIYLLETDEGKRILFQSACMNEYSEVFAMHDPCLLRAPLLQNSGTTYRVSKDGVGFPERPTCSPWAVKKVAMYRKYIRWVAEEEYIPKDLLEIYKAALTPSQ